MATRALLADLAASFAASGGAQIEFTSIGGVDAARRVASGEAFDLVVLASDALAQLVTQGHVVADSACDLVRSSVAVAVPAGAPAPDIGSEAALKHALLAADKVGYSTGPSGTQLLALLARWGIQAQMQDRLVQAPPGVPVGSMLAQGQVSLGFQQRSELMDVDGILLLGDMPTGAEIHTLFSAGLCRVSAQAAAVHALLKYFVSPETAEAKRRQGMQPA